MTVEHPPALLRELQGITTPTIANAIELFNVRPREIGFASGAIRCIFPSMPAVIGYACTATMKAATPPGERRSGRAEMWQHILSLPSPRIIVVQDEDEPPAVGSLWGEVNGSVHKALGAVAVVTDGGIRDIDELEAMGMQMFAREVIVSHANVHLTSVGKPVTIGGLTVNPGDLLHGDKHGVIQIPHEITAQIPDAVRRIDAFERPIIDLCRSPEFSVEKLDALFQRRM